MTETGKAQPSAFVPFCTFQGETPIKATSMKNLPLKACSGLEPVLFTDHFHGSGQTCYRFNPGSTAGQGVVHSLMMLLDVNSERSSSFVRVDRRGEDSSSSLDLVPAFQRGLAEVNIHTLSTFRGLSSPKFKAHFKMSVLKQTTGSKAFSALSDSKKKCSNEFKKACESRLWLDRLRNTCACQPISLAILELQVMCSTFFPLALQDLPWCGPNGTTCSNTLNTSDHPLLQTISTGLGGARKKC